MFHNNKAYIIAALFSGLFDPLVLLSTGCGRLCSVGRVSTRHSGLLVTIFMTAVFWICIIYFLIKNDIDFFHLTRNGNLI